LGGETAAVPHRPFAFYRSSRSSHPPTCARAFTNKCVYIYSIISLYAPTPFGYVQLYIPIYRSWHGEPRKMGAGTMIEIICSGAEVGEKIKSRRYMHETCFVLQHKGMRYVYIDEIADFEVWNAHKYTCPNIVHEHFKFNLNFPNLRACMRIRYNSLNIMFCCKQNQHHCIKQYCLLEWYLYSCMQCMSKRNYDGVVKWKPIPDNVQNI